MTKSITEKPEAKNRPNASVSTTGMIGDATSAHIRLTGEESILLRALVAGHDQKRICKDLRMDTGTFYRLLRDLREKTGAADPVGLVIWALRQANNGDQRTEERHHAYIRPDSVSKSSKAPKPSRQYP